MDYKDTESGILDLRNRTGRVDSIEVTVNEILGAEGKKMDSKRALSLRGELAFAEGHTFCRLTAYVARALSEWASLPGLRGLTEEMELDLRLALHYLKHAGPRKVRPKSDEPQVLIFTDGACEDLTSIGGLLLAPGMRPEVFGCVMRAGYLEA